MRPGSAALLLTAALGALSGEATAFGSLDPFATGSLVPPPPVLSPAPESDYVPCKTPAADAVYGVVAVVDLALCRNPQTREAWANARVQAAQVGLAQGAFLPDLDGKVTRSQVRLDGNETSQAGASLTLSWLLYDFGARSATLENARQLMEAATSTLDATVQNVFLAAMQAYYNAQATRAAVVAAIESERASRESLAAAEVRYRVGTGTPADRLQAQTALSQATLNRIKVEVTQKNALGTLANVMGFDASEPLRLADLPQTLPDPSFERNVDTLIGEARRLRPDLRAAEAQVRAARANVDFARASGLPTLSLGAGPNWQDTGSLNTHGNSIGLTLTLPIFSGFDTTYRVRAAQARVEAAAAQQENLRQQVALDVWTNYQNLVASTQAIRTTADLLASAEQSERVALGRYKAGVGSILDVLNAQSALASARLQRIQARLDWSVSRASLAKAVGALDGRLLNIGTDPGKP